MNDRAEEDWAEEGRAETDSVAPAPEEQPSVGRPDVPLVITGAAGWIGSALLANSAPGVRLRALVREPAEVEAVLALAPTAELVVGDLNEPETLQSLFAGLVEPEVVHAAGVIHPERVADFERVNVDGTKAVLGAAERAGARRFVHVSSNSVHGVNPHPTDVFGHQEPMRPYLGYGESKMRAELAVREAHRQGFETVVVRPPWFYGPHQPDRQTRFFTLIAAGRFPVIGDGSQRRSMVYVDNLVQGISLALSHPDAAGGAYWVADARAYPFAEIVETVRQVLAEEGYRVSDRTLHAPAAIGRFAERADRWLQGRGRYLAEVHVLGELDKTIACDISVTERVLGYRPRIALAEGMRRSLQWCARQGIEVAPRADGARR